MGRVPYPGRPPAAADDAASPPYRPVSPAAPTDTDARITAPEPRLSGHRQRSQQILRQTGLTTADTTLLGITFVWLSTSASDQTSCVGAIGAKFKARLVMSMWY